ncbi:MULTISPECIES: sulfatase family protein [Hyphomonas]
MLPTLAGALLTGWLTVKVLTYKQVDDPIRLQSKAAYLGKVSTGSELRRQNNKPNILLILYDDLGLGDLGFSGASAIKTPNIDALARDGVIFNNFHAAAAICSPSRASLLTGRLPHHAGVQSVVFPSDSWMRLFSILPGFNVRIPAEEITLADILKADGYKTAMVGKWHIGDRAPSLPHLMGFDQFFGALYSNDMEPFALYRDDAVELDAPIDQDQLDEIYTNEMVRLISESSESAAPFFLYFAHNFPHEPLHAPAAQRGSSDAGLYGDVVESLDAGIGEIVDSLKSEGLFENTLIILTSDNGPWYQGNPAGLRGRKGQTFEGGTRVPMLIHWPGGLSDVTDVDVQAMAIDILPTILDWLSIPLPDDRQIDGRSLSPLLAGEASARDGYLYFYSSGKLMAVSDGRFKYHAAQPLPYTISGSGFTAMKKKGPWLINLSSDPYESYNVADRYPEVADRLSRVLTDTRVRDLENPRGWIDPS